MSRHIKACFSRLLYVFRSKTDPSLYFIRTALARPLVQRCLCQDSLRGPSPAVTE